MDTNNTSNSSNNLNAWGIPLAIVIAGALIAGALYFSRTDKSTIAEEDTSNISQAAEKAILISKEDHIRGKIDAKVRVIEYSDMECPFCKEFHDTMNQIFPEYEDKISWVYRHFPIQNIHPKAVTEAVASECVAEIGGNEKFWQFVDNFFEVTPSNNQTDLSILPKLARDLGINEDQFNTCLQSGKYDDLIKNQFDQAIQTGGQGTPWTLVVTKSGRVLSINGAQPYAVVKQIIDTALAD